MTMETVHIATIMRSTEEMGEEGIPIIVRILKNMDMNR
jgi:hypothetical protein